MSRLDRYIAGTVLGGALAALVILLALNFVVEFIEEAEDIGTGGYGLGTAVATVLLEMLQRAYEAFPMATLIGALVSLGTLAARHELVAIRAAGVSVAGVARPVVIAGLLLALIASALGEWLAPPATRLAQQLRSQAQGGEVAAAAEGFWVRDGERYLQAERAPARTVLEGVTVYRLADNRLVSITRAPRAEYLDGGWQLQAAEVTRFSAAGVTVEPPTTRRLAADLAPQTLEVVVLEPATLAAGELLRYVRYLENNGLSSDRYRLALWIKVATPLATVTMLVLTVPLVFASQRGGGAGQQIFIGVLVGLAFFLLNRFLNNAGVVYGLPPVVSALAPVLIFLALGLWGLRRVR
ncbi:LPS export ABC transporter permease LptG [Sediminicurvatus halobius]|uniref:LPS export ABC transporter permease LptG n=1 Tax=Sediminicurvatus halobius TaxID=2182432 RepID=A0A2U2N172_9GAMM|nr:LPS export ABC transporter permease LptG [Spiribacter halobius]PWG62812.1 LPS export ABC transporter permease LptG [Spiribacter halobius]UEX77040.1 LPS export ABC transporter permease LptG [Spiribacter halobius]